MIEAALISGSLRKALYRDRGGAWVLTTDSAEPVLALPQDFATFRYVAREVAHADPSGLPISIDTLKARLDEEITFVEGLDGLLVGMDPEFSEGVRRSAIREGERVLNSSDSVAKRIRDRILKPVERHQWDPEGAFQLAGNSAAPAAAQIYCPLADGTLDRIMEDLGALVASSLGQGVEAAQSRETILQSGLVAELCLLARDRRALLAIPFRVDQFPGLRAADPGGRILTGLVKHLAGPSREGPAAGDSPQSTDDDPLIKAALLAAELQSERKRRGFRLLEHDLDAIQREISWIGERLKENEFARAESALVRLIEDQAPRSKPEHIVKTLTGVADQARRLKQFKFAMRLLDAADFLDARDSAAMCVRGELLRDMRQPEQALAVFQESIARFPSDEISRNAFAEALREVGRTDEALASLRETMDLFPEDSVSRNAYAETLRELGRPGEAMALFRETMERFPEDQVARNAYAETLCEAGETDEAFEILRQTMKHFPDDMVSRNIYGETLRKVGRPEEAIVVFQETIANFKEAVVARNAYAETLRELGQFEKALAALRESIEYFPHDDATRNTYAETLREIGRFDEALTTLRDTMARSPHDDVARNSYAETLREAGRPEEALAVLRETMETFPHGQVAFTAYGHMLRGLGRREEALQAFQEAMRRFQRNAVAATAYAETLRAVGRRSEALAWFQSTMERFPRNPVVRNAYAEALREEGASDRALSVLGETMKRFPHDEFSRNAYAETLREIGRPDEALAIFRETMDRFPRDQVARNAAANLLIAQGRVHEGEELLKPAIERLRLREDWIALHISAMGHLRRKSTSIALEMLRRGRDECPFQDSILYFRSALAVALIMDQRAKDALLELEPIIQQTTSSFNEATNRLIKAHALGECGDIGSSDSELTSIQSSFELSKSQDRLKDLLRAKYVRPKRHARSAVTGAKDNIYEIEIDLIMRSIGGGTPASQMTYN